MLKTFSGLGSSAFHPLVLILTVLNSSLSMGLDKLARKESFSYLSRLRKTIETRRQKVEKDTANSGNGQRKSEPSEGSPEYFQVEINNRHSGGSDRYSVIGEKESAIENDDVTIETPGDYNIIDVTGLVPRSVNCSPLSLHTFLTCPDLVKDLPAAQGRKVGRSISFLSQGEYQRMRMKRTERKTSQVMNTQAEQKTRKTNNPVMVKRSLSAVTQGYKPQIR